MRPPTHRRRLPARAATFRHQRRPDTPTVAHPVRVTSRPASRGRLRRHLTLGAAAALLCAAGIVGVANAASAAPSTAVFTKVSEWSSGYEGKFTLTNGGSAAINGWNVQFDLPGGTTISSNWESLRTTSGSHNTFTNVSWNATIQPGQSVTFGFIASGSGSPSACTFNGAACGGGTTTPPPAAPTNLRVTGTTNSSISLAWDAPSGTVTGYRVIEAGTVVATSSTTPVTVGSLAAGSTHTYSVRAFNSGGESPSSASVTASTTGQSGIPAAPTNVRVTATTDTSITVAWNASTTANFYRVYEGTTVRATGQALDATISSLGACTTHAYTVTAVNSFGESPKSAEVPATTTGCSTGPLPRHFLTGYWHNFTNPATELRLSAVPGEFDLVAVAFAEATSTPGAVTFAVDPGLSTALGGYTDAQFRADVQTLHSRGKKVILSVGGEAGRVSVADSTAATNFANSMFNLIQSFGFDGVDIDLENGLNATFMGQALRNLRNRVGANLIITMAPQTIDMQSTGTQYFQLALNIRDILTVVHTQYYNSGSMLGCDQMQPYSQGTVNFMTALACIQLENGLRPDQVALGLPAGPGAANGGVVPPSMVNDALNCLARGTNCGSFRPPHTYPGIRGAMTWSINWDVSNGNNFARTVRPFLNTLP
jgi:chitinase